MELKQLHYFLTVIDCGSVGRAARRLGISQPALTRSIRSLEHALGAPLFVRSSDGMSLNHVGRSLERRARSVSIEIDRAEREIRELLGAERGRIVIGTSQSFASSVLIARVLPTFRASHPNVQVVVIEGFFETSTEAILAGEMDLACGTVPADLPRDNLVCEILVPHERIFVVAGRDNPIVARRRLTLAEIQRGPWILSRGGSVRVRLNEFFTRRGLPAPEPAFLYNSVSFAKELLRKGRFISLLSGSAVREELAAGTLRIVRVPDLVMERDVGMIYRAGSAPTPAAQLLIDRVRTASAEYRRGLRRL